MIYSSQTVETVKRTNVDKCEDLKGNSHMLWSFCFLDYTKRYIPLSKLEEKFCCLLFAADVVCI